MIKPAALIAASTLWLCACTSLGPAPTSKLAAGTLHSASGAVAGTVVIVATGDTVTINVTAIGLAEGAHGVHLHTIGTCDGPAFASAGGHLNPHAKQHGSANPAGSHLGDLPNLVIDGYGAGTLTAKLSDGRTAVEAALYDADGSALVIHADSDDYKTDPSGNSGPRIACAVLQRG